MCDGKYNASDASNVLRLRDCDPDAFGIREDLKRVFQLSSKDKIELVIKFEFSDMHKNYRYNIVNGKLIQDLSVLKQNVDDAYDYNQDCYTSGRFTTLPESYGQAFRGKGGDLNNEWSTAYQGATNVLTNSIETGDIDSDKWRDELKEEWKALSAEQRSELVEYFAKRYMSERHDYTSVRGDAILPDGTTYSLVIGQDKNWYLEKVADGVSAWETELSYK